mmetsp:Transcript_72404/g.200774  ORF Transcript_72404/g.200774 Transcript_72404/m.200774 type:complete len:520 (-) Transcript_72404:15-1574(-)
MLAITTLLMIHGCTMDGAERYIPRARKVSSLHEHGSLSHTFQKVSARSSLQADECPNAVYNHMYVAEQLRIGEGSFGEVYPTKFMGDKDMVEKRIAHNASQQMITSEKSVGRMALPFNLHTRDVFIPSDSQAIITMPRAMGGSLYNLIMNPKFRLGNNVTDGLRAGSQLAFGLWSLHAAGWISRDVKVDNILMLNQIGANVQNRFTHADYGVAFHCPKGLNCSTGAAGTKQYMAPNMFKGAYGQEVDWFAFHVALFVTFNKMNLLEEVEGHEYYEIDEDLLRLMPPDGYGQSIKEYLKGWFKGYGNFTDIFRKHELVQVLRDFNKIDEHPVMGHDLWIRAAQLIDIGMVPFQDSEQGEHQLLNYTQDELQLHEYTRDRKEALKEYWTRVCHLYAEDPCLCPNHCYKRCRNRTDEWQQLRSDLDSMLLSLRPQVKILLLNKNITELAAIRDTMNNVGRMFGRLRDHISRGTHDDDAACTAPDCVSDLVGFCTTCCECKAGKLQMCDACVDYGGPRDAPST